MLMDMFSKSDFCASMEKFVSFDKSEELTLRFLCESVSPSYYDTLPFLKELSKYNTYHRLLKMRFIALRFSIVAFLLLILSFFIQEIMLSFFVAAIIIMVWYVFYQLVSDDIDSVRVFEVCFSNVSFISLKNMNVLNTRNRVIELNPLVSYNHLYKDKKGWRVAISIRTWIKYLLAKGERRKMIVGYLFGKKEALVLGALSTTGAERNLQKGIKEVETHLEGANFKISKIFLFKKENGNTQILEVI